MSTSDHHSHRTLAWVERTYQPGRAGPVRGGLRTDHRARAQVAVSVGLVVLLLAALAALPTRSPSARVVSAPLSSGPGSRVAPAAPPPVNWMPAWVTPSPAGAEIPWYARTVPPPAPVWLDGPGRETPLPPGM